MADPHRPRRRHEKRHCVLAGEGFRRVHPRKREQGHRARSEPTWKRRSARDGRCGRWKHRGVLDRQSARSEQPGLRTRRCRGRRLPRANLLSPSQSGDSRRRGPERSADHQHERSCYFARRGLRRGAGGTGLRPIRGRVDRPAKERVRRLLFGRVQDRRVSAHNIDGWCAGRGGRDLAGVSTRDERYPGAGAFEIRHGPPIFTTTQSGSQPRFGIRVPATEDLWVKKEPGHATHQRDSGVGGWDAWPNEWKLHRGVEQSLSSASQRSRFESWWPGLWSRRWTESSPPASCNDDPNGPDCDHLPVDPSNVLDLGGGDLAVAFIGRADPRRSMCMDRGRADGTIHSSSESTRIRRRPSGDAFDSRGSR